MNFICKIVEDLPSSQQLSVKFCRQNSPKSIDEYPSYSIDYSRLDFTDYDSFVHSLLLSGHQIILNQLSSEPSLPSNLEVEETNSTNVSDNLNKILCKDGKDIVPSDSYYYKILAKKSIPEVDSIGDVLSNEEITDILNKIDLHKKGEDHPKVEEKKKTKRTRKKSSTDS